MKSPKLYIIVRSDLPPGAQVAQSCHALRLFVEEHPIIDEHWHRHSNNLVCLQVENLPALLELAEKAELGGHAHSVFVEPDFDDQPTAMALEPDAWKLVRRLGLCLKVAA